MQLAILGFLIQPFILGVHLHYVEFFPFFSDGFIWAENFFKNSHFHVWNLVPFLAKMFTCCFFCIAILGIPLMLTKPLLKGTLTLPYVLYSAPVTFYTVQNISGLTINWFVDIYFEIWGSWCDGFALFDKLRKFR